MTRSNIEDIANTMVSYQSKVINTNRMYYTSKNPNFLEKSYNIFKEACIYTKKIQTELFNAPKEIITDKEFHKVCSFMGSIINSIQTSLPKQSIVTKEDVESIEDNGDKRISYIVKEAQKYLKKRTNMDNLDDIDLEGYCYNSARNIMLICNELNVKHAEPIHIYAGFNKDAELFMYDGKHYGTHAFSIINIDDQSYLVDCTYSQFFWQSKNVFEKIGIFGMSGSCIGNYMLDEPNRKKTALTLLKNGWIKLDDKTFKDYLDGFTLGYYNGLYFDAFKDFSFSTPFSSDDYWNFLNKDDSFLNYSDKVFIGPQTRPLKNPELKIVYK